MTILKLLVNTIVILAATAFLIIFVPGLPPNIEPEPLQIQPPRKVGGWFASNNILDEAEVYYESAHGGTESVAILNDKAVFTGDETGTLVKVTNFGTAEFVARLGFPCNVETSSPRGRLCGWPLGMRFDNEGHLLTMDYFGGLTRVNIETGSYESIIPKSRPINDKIAHVPEDFDIAKDGTIYWTDGSTTGNFFVEMVGQPSGRLIKYNHKTQTNEVLLDNLYFSNGVCLSEDEEFVLVVETGYSRILRYYLKGPKRGQNDTFVDGLPGYPDNLRSNGRGGFYVALAAPWNDQYSMRLHLLANWPLVRKLISRSGYILLTLIRRVKEFIPDNFYLNHIEKSVRVSRYEPILNLGSMPKTATVIELSKSGEIIGILNGRSGKISRISQISVGKNYAFLVSPFEGKIWRIKLDVLRRMW